MLNQARHQVEDKLGMSKKAQRDGWREAGAETLVRQGELSNQV